ncbi:murein L,D-transpeptidase catalytic domain-containing protein [Bdellovibrio sp. HCB-110]|uniref:murein L,D-transpeptidase catalytic domain-containing protein n=1 Tax=Bdellovibrio sp. HCB-110 TaxID=3391182 RepID=UPI0039B46CD0
MDSLVRIFPLILFLSVNLFVTSAGADSLFNRRLGNGRFLFDVLLEQGVPREPLDLIFRMFDYNEGRVPNVVHTVLVDYSRPSTEKRLYLINLTTGGIEKFYVAHGIRSGVVETRSFSNLLDSWKSSLGFYFAKGTYMSEKNGISLYLDGIDRSNSNAKNRTIVLHGAKYVSDEFILKNGRLGWSEGCFAVGLEHVNYLISVLQNGSILLSYHKDLIGFSRRYPSEQAMVGNEIVPPGVNTSRTPGEGGGLDFLPSIVSF